MKVIWSEWALRQVERIHSYYSAEANAAVADRMIGGIVEATRLLEQFPFGGQVEPWLEQVGQGHRRVVVGNYKVVYRVVEDPAGAGEVVVRIIDVFDARQDPGKMKV